MLHQQALVQSASKWDISTPLAVQVVALTLHFCSLTFSTFYHCHDWCCKAADGHDDAENLDSIAHHPQHEAHEANLAHGCGGSRPQGLPQQKNQ